MILIHLILLLTSATFNSQANNFNHSITTLQDYKDEFNYTLIPSHEALALSTNVSSNQIGFINEDNEFKTLLKPQFEQPLESLRNILLAQPARNCCKLINVTSDVFVQEELKRKFGRYHKTLTAKDFLQELNSVLSNLTIASIDGQPANDPAEKYYKFYDNLHYFLRLLRLAKDPLESTANSQSVDFFPNKQTFRSYRRKLRALEFKFSKDPLLSSFLSELKTVPNVNPTQVLNQTNSLLETNTFGDEFNKNFEFFEDFLRHTKFGDYYTRNVTLIRDIVARFDKIYAHFELKDVSANLTRPSRQYKVLREMSRDLFKLKDELLRKCQIRILANNDNVARILTNLNQLVRSQPYVRMLGDEFSLSGEFGSNVRILTKLLDAYLNNKMTQLDFYMQLADLPQQFIELGAQIAFEFESKELASYRFNSNSLPFAGKGLTGLSLSL